MKRIILGIFGIFLIFVGIIGWILPVLPGWLFIFFGLSFIAPAFAARLKRRVLRKFFKKEIVTLDEWKRLNVHAGFTTRHFSLVLHKADDLLNENTQRCFHEAISGAGFEPAPTRYVFLNQVHGDNIQVLEGENQLGRGAVFAPNGRGNPATTEFYHLMNTDGVLTDLKNTTLLVLTADCLPVFLSAGKGERQWIGLAHAGWRGTEKEIARKALEMIRERSGCGASDIRAILGPRIGKDHYEVGKEFMDYFGRAGARERAPLRQKAGKLYFDLVRENKRQLIEAGAKPGNILDLGICTISENEDFYSFRKEKEAAGRIISFISKF